MYHSMVRSIAAVFVIFCMNSASLQGVSLDGSLGTSIYVPAFYTFSHNDFAKGFVYFDLGFGVTAGATMTIGIHPPVEGSINLSGTGKMILKQDLYVAGEITGGGSIATLPPSPGVEISINQLSGAVAVISHPYKILNDLVWDGHGAILNVDSPTPSQSFNSQPGFIIQPGVSVVFSNVDLVGWSFYPAIPYTPIRFVENNGMFSNTLTVNCIFDTCGITTLLESTTSYSNCNIFLKDTHISGRESTFILKSPKVLPQNVLVDAGVNFNYTPTTYLFDSIYGLDFFGMEVFDGFTFDNCTITTTVPLKFPRGAVRSTGVVDFVSTATARRDRLVQIGEQALGKRCDLDLLPGTKFAMNNMELRYDNQY